MATMAQLRYAVKAHAKRVFSENAGRCIAVSLIVSGITLLVSSIASVYNIVPQLMPEVESIVTFTPQLLLPLAVTLLFSILVFPLTVGSFSFFMGTAAGAKMKVSSIFVWLGDLRLFGKALGTYLFYFLLSMFWMIICLFVPIIIVVLLLVYEIEGSLLLTGMIIWYVIFLVGVIFAEIKILSLIPAIYLLAENPNIKIREAFILCRGMMRGHKWEFFVFNLSFLGWQLLASVTCGLSLLYVYPYMQLATATYVRQRFVMYAAQNINASDSDASETDTTN